MSLLKLPIFRLVKVFIMRISFDGSSTQKFYFPTLTNLICVFFVEENKKKESENFCNIADFKTFKSQKKTSSEKCSWMEFFH